MCGIYGYFDQTGASLEPRQLEAMAQLIGHRGPDDRGLYAQPGSALGNTRLSIVDINGGHQPFVSDDGQIIVVQNGEIFNYLELSSDLVRDGFNCRTACDTEVLLRLYERDGIDMVRHLNGMFAIAILDRRQNRMYLIRDRIGVKPLFYWLQDGRLLFASEIKSILAAGVSPRMDHTALDQFLTFNYVPKPLTMFKGVVHLEPGCWLQIDPSGYRTHRWWELSNKSVILNRDESTWIEEFRDVLDDAVRLRLRCDVPFGAFLSGGIDSTTIVGMMSKHLSDPVRTYAIGFHEPEYDESGFAQSASRRFGTRHTMERVGTTLLDLWPRATWHCDQPHGDISFLPTYHLSKLAARDIKVVLTGDGADELFAGYDKHREFFDPKRTHLYKTDAAFQRAYKEAISLFRPQSRLKLYSDRQRGQIADYDSFEALAPLFKNTTGMDRINQALYLDTQLLLSGNNLVKPDRMGMAVALEARTPFLDYRMMELAFRMPGELKLRGGETKYIYKQAIKDLIGEELAFRKKQMFTVPVGKWFRVGLAPLVRELLLNERAKSRGLFSAEAVQSLVDQHQAGEMNHTRELRALIAVELWHRIFIDTSYSAPPDFQSLGIDSRVWGLAA
jgi:asparagine synthase (glutamine-hydrolysing)